jgi:hypothetical protein
MTGGGTVLLQYEHTRAVRKVEQDPRRDHRTEKRGKFLTLSAVVQRIQWCPPRGAPSHGTASPPRPSSPSFLVMHFLLPL